MTVALDHFREVLRCYNRTRKINSVSLYYNGHHTTQHHTGGGPDLSADVVRKALVDYWHGKLELALASAREQGVELGGEMPDWEETKENES